MNTQNATDSLHLSHLNGANPLPVPHYANVQDCLDFAGVCCLRARDAAHSGHMRDAAGLIQTGVTLFERAAYEHTSQEDAHDAAFSQRLDELAGQLFFSAQLIEVEAAAQASPTP